MSKDKITIASPRGIIIPAAVLKREKDYPAGPHEPVEVPRAYGLSLIENRFADEVEPTTIEKPKASSSGRSTGRPKGQTAQQPDDQPDASADTLIGTNILPALIEIAPGKEVPLGEVVAKAHAKSGLSLEEWNALPEADRDALLTSMVDELKAEASQQQP